MERWIAVAILFLCAGLFCLGQAPSTSNIKLKRAAFGIFQTSNPNAAAACADSVPAGAAAFGFNTCTFSSPLQSLSRVDTNNANTSTASTDWWPSNLFQNFVVPSGNFSISGGGMRISRGAGITNADNSPSLQSIYYPYPYSQGGTWHGRTFTNGFYWRVYYAVNVALAPSPTNVSFPAIWMDNGIGLDRTAYCEIDSVEHMATSAGSFNNVFFKHDWLNFNDRSTQFASVSNADIGNPTFDGVAFNSLDLLWVPMSKNGGNGLIQVYYNGTHLTKTDLQYSSGGNAILGSGGIDPANFNGAFSVCDSNAAVGFALYLTVGHSGTNASPTDWPMIFKNIQVWQTQTSDMIVN